MGRDVLSQPHFHDEEEARVWFEAARWDNKPICPKCGSAKHYTTKKVGVYRCAASACRKDFTVMTGSVMERSHVKLTLWAKAFYLMASSKKGFSAHQLHRALGCQYNTAWFLYHRVREAMRRGGLDLLPMGGEGKVVEADETYFGNISESRIKPGKGPRKALRGKGPLYKRAVLSLVERGGEVRSFHIPYATKESVMTIVKANVAAETHLMTDEGGNFRGSRDHFAGHSTVVHSKGQYVRRGRKGEPLIHSNTIEGYFSIFKRGMRGVYQHCSEKHLHRYLAEFDFRYSTRQMSDEERTLLAIKGGGGKRLTYHPAS
ncbi:MAG: IS1595 family transposase [Proteobacteria bacterium]|nr:IS1595 family transposase [Pseudomonadota bacterium]